MSSKKAEVVQIDRIDPHPNADRLEIVRVYDYTIVVGKGEFKPGDRAIYVPVDMVVPLTENWKWLHDDKPKNCRVKAKKLRGIVSYGLIVPLQCEDWATGQDVSGEMGIVPYTPPEPKAQTNYRRYKEELNALPKYTDIENLQRYPGVLIPMEPVYVTEKIHGCNARFGWIDGKWYVGSHRIVRRAVADRLGPLRQAYRWLRGWKEDVPPDIWWKVAKQYGLKDKLKQFPGLVFFGEIYGDVQDLRYGCRSGELRLAIFDIHGPRGYWSWPEVVVLCDYLGLPIVPTISPVARLMDGRRVPTPAYSFDSLNEGPSLVPGANHLREGCVIRPINERYDGRVGRVIFKLINPDYLVRKDGTEMK